MAKMRACPICGTIYPPPVTMCAEHGADLVEVAEASETREFPQSGAKADGQDIGVAGQPSKPDDPAPETALPPELRTPRQPAPVRSLRATAVVAGRTFQVPGGRGMVLGRQPELPTAAALEPFDNVSRVHCRLFIEDGLLYVIEDRASTNGTFVDGRRIPPGTPVRLAPEAALRLASNVMVPVVQSEETH